MRHGDLALNPSSPAYELCDLGQVAEFLEARFLRCTIDTALLRTACFANHGALPHKCEVLALNKNASGSGQGLPWHGQNSPMGLGIFFMESKLSVGKAETAASCYHV